MNIFRFLDWEMYRDAKRLNQDIGQIAKNFSIDFKRKYGDQLQRAVLSISLNIAEAAGRYSELEMCRFLNVALGSAAEAVACLDHLRADGYLSDEQFSNFFQKIRSISRQIQGLQHSAYQQPRIYKKTLGH